MNNSTCPNCGSIAEKPYSRKRQCKECGSFVYFSKRYPYIFQREVLSLAEVKLLDFYQTVTALLGIDNDESIYDSVCSVLAKKWDATPKPFDIVWAIANSADQFIKFEPNELATTAYRTGKLLEVSSYIDLARARFMPYYDNRHTPQEYLRSSLNHSLQKMRLDKVSKVVIYANRCCKSCLINDGIKLSIDEAEKIEFIPRGDCDNRLIETKFAICTCEFIDADMYDELKAYLY